MADSDSSTTDSERTDLYKIGTVAKLTDISVERLRAWERRYGLVPAERAGKTRYYSAEQVARLKRLRALIDQGHPISTLINLSDADLASRLAPPPTHPAAAGSPRIGLIGTQLLMLEQDAGSDSRLDVAARWVSVDAWQKQPVEVDLLICLLGSLNKDSLQTLESVSGALILYHFATPDAVESAAQLGLATERWPLGWDAIEDRVRRLSRAPLRAGARVARRYSEGELLDVASASDAAGCRSPRHLTELIEALNAFEDHSQACSRDEPAIAPRHAATASAISRARSTLEEELGEWIEATGLVPLRN
ncbi:MAG: MerR family transcriptional regulator [Pseudomonadota bacterium]